MKCVTPKIVVIGAGVGGLAAAASLAKAGFDVTVLEAHVYAGGCAGTFFHKGYRFDAGATLAGGFYTGGPMDLLAQATGVDQWPAQPANPAMTVHLPDGSQITRWGDERRWDEYEAAFGAESLHFWRWQEDTADALWDLALRLPNWPPQSLLEAAKLTGSGFNWLVSDARNRFRPALLADSLRSVATHLPKHSARLRQFVDAQLLIAAQTTSPHANALYGASALDLPRRGVVHLKGGMGAIAGTLVAALLSHGGQIHFRQEVKTVREYEKRSAEGGRRNRRYEVVTKRGQRIEADAVIANLPPWNIARLLGEAAPLSLRKLLLDSQVGKGLKDGWGAFMVYAGIDDKAIPTNFPLHQQIVAGEPMGEGNTLFLSLSPAWDKDRAPSGQRVLTMSTHTRLAPWWQDRARSKEAYATRKAEYLERMVNVACGVFLWLHESIKFVMAGSPITFQHFTRREQGWVGGFPQTSLFRAWAPRLSPNLWMVGDSIFPGQSTAAVALGGLRVAGSVKREIERLRD